MYPEIDEAKNLIAELCRLFYDQGWVSGTGGGISIRATGDRIAMAPSGVQKERMVPEDMFVLDKAGNILETPRERPSPYKPPKLSECSPLFMLAYEHRDAGAVMHSHSMNAVMATMLDPQASEFRCTHLEMMKGIVGHGFYDTMVIPIIENTARECELTERMRAAMLAYPKSNACLVRRHGVYVWGSTWIEAKTQAECYDYLFGIAAKMQATGVPADAVPAPLPMPATANGKATFVEQTGQSVGPPAKKARKSKLPTCVVLDIEGTVAPISFVADVLFPYARQHVRAFLQANVDDPDTLAAVDLLRQQAAEDAAIGVAAAPIPRSPPAAVITAVMANVEAQMDGNRKTRGLKALQGLVWHTAYVSGAIKGELFRDAPDALQQFRNLGVKTYIYSSGSRQAQADLFGHTTVGNMRPYLCGFFDTTSGSKDDASSYKEIALSLGCDTSAEILFATDVLAEAMAARAAGWSAVLVVRPGNKPLPRHDFVEITSMDELLEVY